MEEKRLLEGAGRTRKDLTNPVANRLVEVWLRPVGSEGRCPYTEKWGWGVSPCQKVVQKERGFPIREEVGFGQPTFLFLGNVLSKC